jgi:hypothetical protein
MKERSVAFCPTLAAGDAYDNTMDGKKELIPNRKALSIRKKSFNWHCSRELPFAWAVMWGVFTHGDNAREMEMMVDYGMKPIDVLRSSTSINADVFRYGDKVGRIKKDLFADISCSKW